MIGHTLRGRVAKPSKDPPMAKDSEDKRRIIVGIAASAGGLEAATALVRNLPKHVNATYVVAQHMSPTHESLLTALISRETALPVVELGDAAVTPDLDTIYITPPNKDVIVQDGKLKLVETSGRTAIPEAIGRSPVQEHGRRMRDRLCRDRVIRYRIRRQLWRSGHSRMRGYYNCSGNVIGQIRRDALVRC